MLAGIVAWTAFAFGGVYPGTLALPAAVLIALAAAYRPAIAARGPAPIVDWALLAVLGAGCLQLLPLPRPVLEALSPAAGSIARALLLADAGGPLPLSIDVAATAAAMLICGGAVVLFFTARQIFDTGGVRTCARAVAIAGLALSAIAVAQDATSGGLMYWRWRPIDEAARPFGPFVNRNHFATWAVMAIPLCLGYLTAHGLAHRTPAPHANWRRRLTAALDGRAVLLLASSALLVVALTVSLSRAGIVGLAAALLCGGELARRLAPGPPTGSARPAMLIVALGALCLFAGFGVLVRVGPSAVASRFAAADVAMADRVTIWRDTVPVLKDFWLTGTGAGTYETAMAVYQRSSPGVLFNQAHNHYLQAAAEGGLLVLAPLVVALGAFARAAWRRLVADRSGMFWLRAGAASGLAGVAVQSLWETGLTTPANAAMAALLAAVVLHVPARFGPPALR